MFSLISAWTNGWVNTRNDDNLRHNRAYYDATVASWSAFEPKSSDKSVVRNINFGCFIILKVCIENDSITTEKETKGKGIS